MQKKNIVILVVMAGFYAIISGSSVFAGELSRDMSAEMNSVERKQLLLEYAALATAENEAPLREFRDGAASASQALGKLKAAMVFHLLRRLAGQEKHFLLTGKDPAGLSPRHWDEFSARFEKELGRDLGWFFKQWVDRKGLPELRAEQVSVRRYGGRFELSFDLVQKSEVYILDVPLSIDYVGGGGTTELVRLDAEKKKVVLIVDEEPGSMTIDREYELPRKLTDAETPPLLAKLMSGGKLVLVTAATETGIYADPLAAWKLPGAEVRRPDSIKDGEVKESSLLVFGADNPILNRLYGEAGRGNEELGLTARKNPWNPDKVVVIIEARTAQVASGAVRAIREQGVCSALSLDGQGRVTIRKTDETADGIVTELREEAGALDVSALMTLSRVIEGVSGKRIVYVGEHHDEFAHHNIQVRIIKGLSGKGPKLAVGMEMFQRPFQKTLDEYISGAIDERDFLDRAEYFKRWNFDYNLYKPILDFCRAEKVPVIALNLRRELTDKVSKTGMDSLSDEERKDLPEHMDFSDTGYRERLRSVFDQHSGSSDRNFDYFLQAQILWDETMARTIDEYLRENPDRRIVVLAGEGHLAYGSGIPKRVFRRNGLPFATVLSDSEIEQGIADFVVFPQALDGMMAPKIMAMLREDGGQVSITDLPDGSVSRKAGMKAGDIVASIDQVPVRSVNDIKIALLYKQSGETLRIKVVRKRFLLGDSEKEFEVVLP